MWLKETARNTLYNDAVGTATGFMKHIFLFNL